MFQVFFLFNKFTDISKIMFSLCHYEVWSVNYYLNNNLNNCNIRLQHNKIEKREGGLITF